MKVAVVLLRRNGMRLREPELAPPLVGHLQIDHWKESNFKRPIRSANLYELNAWGQIHRSLPVMLADPVLLCVDGDRFSLAGIELRVEDKRVIEVQQVWRCTLVS